MVKPSALCRKNHTEGKIHFLFVCNVDTISQPNPTYLASVLRLSAEHHTYIAVLQQNWHTELDGDASWEVCMLSLFRRKVQGAKSMIFS